jgi:pimeloyl-ACP methyl ester carboxylesterase
MPDTAAVMGRHRHVDVSGTLLHVWTGGTPGSLPPLVFEAGNGSTLEVWGLIAERLAPQLQMLSYERAGVGASEGGGGNAPDPDMVVARLAGLLDALPQRRPVILVGHSLGGLYGRCYAARHPADIAGLVLIDATPDDLVFPRFLSALSVSLIWTAHLLARVGLLRPGPATGDAQSRRKVAGLQAVARAGHVRACMAEFRDIKQTQQAAARLGLPANLPVLCISAGKRPFFVRSAVEPMLRSHQRLAAAGAAPWSHHHHVAEATHASLLTDPQHAAIVADLILEFAQRIAPRASAAA